MADLIFIAILVAFFALMVAFVRVCERVVGKDGSAGTVPATESDTDTAPIDTTIEEVPA
jgi:hypothetical protein